MVVKEKRMTDLDSSKKAISQKRVKRRAVDTFVPRDDVLRERGTVQGQGKQREKQSPGNMDPDENLRSDVRESFLRDSCHSKYALTP